MRRGPFPTSETFLGFALTASTGLNIKQISPLLTTAQSNQKLLQVASPRSGLLSKYQHLRAWRRRRRRRWGRQKLWCGRRWQSWWRWRRGKAQWRWRRGTGRRRWREWLCERHRAGRKRGSKDDQSLHHGRTSIALANLCGISDNTEKTEGGSFEPHFILGSSGPGGPYQPVPSEAFRSGGLGRKGLSIERIDVGP